METAACKRVHRFSANKNAKKNRNKLHVCCYLQNDDFGGLFASYLQFPNIFVGYQHGIVMAS